MSQLRTVLNADDDVALPPDKEAPTQNQVLAGREILFIDDDRDTAEVLGIALTQAGAKVNVSGSAAAALQILQHKRPALIISDIGMPGVDGFELIRIVRTTLPELAQTPIIALTGYAYAEDGLRCQKAGFQAHLSKPIDPDQLVQEVARILARTTDK